MRYFITTLLTCFITMSLIILVYIAFMPLLSKRYRAKWCYYIWLIIMIGLIPFRPHFNRAVVNLNLYMSFWYAALIIWLIGFLCFINYHIPKYYIFVRMTKRWSEKITNEKALAILEEIKSEMGIAKQINLYLCLSVSSPMMVGILHPIILLPKNSFSEQELKFVLTHELEHYRRKDSWCKLLLLLVNAIHWFNPFVYLMSRIIELQCELSCDEAVLKSADKNTRLQYVKTIISVVKYKSKTSLITNYCDGLRGMKKRITFIMDESPKKAGTIIFCITVVLIVVSGSLVAFKESANNSDAPNTVITESL